MFWKNFFPGICGFSEYSVLGNKRQKRHKCWTGISDDGCWDQEPHGPIHRHVRAPAAEPAYEPEHPTRKAAAIGLLLSFSARCLFFSRLATQPSNSPTAASAPIQIRTDCDSRRPALTQSERRKTIRGSLTYLIFPIFAPLLRNSLLYSLPRFKLWASDRTSKDRATSILWLPSVVTNSFVPKVLVNYSWDWGGGAGSILFRVCSCCPLVCPPACCTSCYLPLSSRDGLRWSFGAVQLKVERRGYV